MPDGLELPDEVPGALTKWIRASVGDWLSGCGFELGGRWRRDQLLPGHVGTPKGYKSLYRLETPSKTNDNYQPFNLTSFDNPHHNSDELEDTRSEIEGSPITGPAVMRVLVVG